MGSTIRRESTILILLLQILSIWVSEPRNNTDQQVFSNSLLRSTTVIILEEYIQENTELRLVSTREEADIYVYPEFIEYIRPNTEASLAILKSKTETVGLEMTIFFLHPDWNFYQQLQCKSEIDKEIRSNFLSIEESAEDFADSLLMNLVKKTINECFKSIDSLIF